MSVKNWFLAFIFACGCSASADEAFVVFEFNSYSRSYASSSYSVLPGDTLGQIVNSIYGKSANRKHLFGEIVANNPNSFVNGDPNRLLSGTTLNLPKSGSTHGDGRDDIYFF